MHNIHNMLKMYKTFFVYKIMYLALRPLFLVIVILSVIVGRVAWC